MLFRSPQVPSDLFDSVADNLLQNAVRKSEGDPAFRVEVAMAGDVANVVLSVTDNGEPVSDAVARGLFEAPVPSQAGLGIGLYQAARQARQHGYQLLLARNERGCVRFEIASVGR